MSLISLVALSVIAGSPVVASPVSSSIDLPASASLEFKFDPASAWIAPSSSASDASLAALADQDSARQPSPIDAQPRMSIAHFGEEGTARWNLFAAIASDFGDSTQGIGSIGASYFIADNLSLDAQIDAAYVDQRAENAVGGGFTILFRWHFIAEADWSLYADGGAGMLITNEDVPAHGTNVNFTPQLGGGVSFDLGDDTRLMAGIRWYHVSNANISRNNPGRDMGLFYIGLSFPF